MGIACSVFLETKGLCSFLSADSTAGLAHIHLQCYFWVKTTSEQWGPAQSQAKLLEEVPSPKTLHSLSTLGTAIISHQLRTTCLRPSFSRHSMHYCARLQTQSTSVSSHPNLELHWRDSGNGSPANHTCCPVSRQAQAATSGAFSLSVAFIELSQQETRHY